MVITPDLLRHLELVIGSYPGFNKIQVRVEVLPEGKKDTFWATSVLRYMTDGQSRFDREGVIYLNGRDASSLEDLLKQVSHELVHLLEDISLQDNVRMFLSDRVKVGENDNFTEKG